MENQIIPDEVIMTKIFYIRGQKVMLDKDLAELRCDGLAGQSILLVQK